MKVFISCQKRFGAAVLRRCISDGHEVIGVCCPLDDRHVMPVAKMHGIKTTPAGSLNFETCPRGFDVGVTAHSFDYIGYKTRYIPRIGWIGYHPSLLPRHRGRSSVEWAIKMRDFATGGTVFWLNNGIDRGDIERQQMVWVDPALFALNSRDAAAALWRDALAPLGVNLISDALADISRGVINKTPQDKRFSTFEPSLDVKDIFKPDLLCIGAGQTAI